MPTVILGEKRNHQSVLGTSGNDRTQRFVQTRYTRRLPTTFSVGSLNECCANQALSRPGLPFVAQFDHVGVVRLDDELAKSAGDAAQGSRDQFSLAIEDGGTGNAPIDTFASGPIGQKAATVSRCRPDDRAPIAAGD